MAEPPRSAKGDGDHWDDSGSHAGVGRFLTHDIMLNR